jgi:hypothetical protein
MWRIVLELKSSNIAKGTIRRLVRQAITDDDTFRFVYDEGLELYCYNPCYLHSYSVMLEKKLTDSKIRLALYCNTNEDLAEEIYSSYDSSFTARIRPKDLQKIVDKLTGEVVE